MREIRSAIWLVVAAACVAGLVGPAWCFATQSYDVVVYGGTAGGVIAAVSAAEQGLSVALLEPGRHVGGMVSGGLGKTDHGRKSVIGGMSREFFERVGKHYNEPITWYFEPHVAEKVFKDWLQEANVKVIFNQRVDSVTRSDPLGRVNGKPAGPRITSIRMKSGKEFSARVFIDSSYEGDLMARSGISYTVGREGADQYGESLAGVRAHSQYHQFKAKVSPCDDQGNLLPGVYGGERGEPGQGDHKVQAYNFRICLSNQPDNQVPFPKPADYDPARYELLKRYLQAEPELKINEIMIISMLPNGKTDINNRGAVSSDHIGASWDYPEADYERRQEIWDDHVSYVQGWLYFLANDPGVPKHLQDEINKWGLAKDEFVDTDHWPHQLYIREARRMIGEYVMHQSDLQTERTKPDSIGMGSYNSDSHHVQRIATADGGVVNEGDMQVPVRPYEIAYRTIVPKREQCSNLLVPVCFSASHVAYSSLRMEPQYMIMGHAAGLAAAHAIRNDTPMADVDIAWLQDKLRERRSVLNLSQAIPDDPAAAKRVWKGIVVDNNAAPSSGDWATSTAIGPYVGIDYWHDQNRGKGEKTIRFVPDLPANGRYEVRLAYSPSGNRATNVPVTIQSADGQHVAVVDQTQQPADPPFVSLGTFTFDAGRDGYVEVRNEGTDGHVIVDAAQWLPTQ